MSATGVAGSDGGWARVGLSTRITTPANDTRMFFFTEVKCDSPRTKSQCDAIATMEHHVPEDDDVNDDVNGADLVAETD